MNAGYRRNRRDSTGSDLQSLVTASAPQDNTRLNPLAA
jgi:hypothetical protein